MSFSSMTSWPSAGSHPNAVTAQIGKCTRATAPSQPRQAPHHQRPRRARVQQRVRRLDGGDVWTRRPAVLRQQAPAPRRRQRAPVKHQAGSAATIKLPLQQQAAARLQPSPPRRPARRRGNSGAATTLLPQGLGKQVQLRLSRLLLLRRLRPHGRSRPLRIPLHRQLLRWHHVQLETGLVYARDTRVSRRYKNRDIVSTSPVRRRT